MKTVKPQITPKIRLDIIKEEPGWVKHKFITRSFCNKIVSFFVERSEVLHNAESIEVSILLTNNAEMQRLNNQFLSKDYPTNVLAFPDEDRLYSAISKENFTDDVILGDIAFGLEILEEEAVKYNVSVQDHFTHLLLHALLHLLGYDHEEEEDYEVMKSLEINYLNELGVKIPAQYQ